MEYGRSGTWISLSSTNVFRLVDIGKMKWNLKQNLDSVLLAASGCGGLMGVYSTEHFLSSYGRLEGHRHQIDLYTSLGGTSGLCPSVTVVGFSEILFMTWNEREDHLVFVAQNEIRFSKVNGESAAPAVAIEFLPHSVTSTENGVVGFCRANGKLHLALVEFAESRGQYDIQFLDVSHLLKSTGRKVILPLHLSAKAGGNSLFSEVFVFFETSETSSSVFSCRFNAQPPATKVLDVVLDGVVQNAALPPTGDSIALLTTDGSVYLCTTGLEDVVLLHVGEKDGSSTPPPARSSPPLMFCGSSALLVTEYGKAVRKDEQGNSDSEMEEEGFHFLLVPLDAAEEEVDITEEVPQEARFVPECDGVRIISKTDVQMLQVVPPEAVRVLGIGSVAPGSVLRSGYDAYRSGDAVAARVMNQLQQNIPALLQAIEDCIRTAAFEWDVAPQQYLLRAAVFGKTFCRSFDPDVFVTLTRAIRVRNTLWTGEAEMRISLAELFFLGERRLIRRLVSVGHHTVAWAICEALGCMSDAIRSDWMLSKLQYDIAAGHSEEEAAAGIVHFFNAEKSSRGNEISFTELASVASIHGRRRAALVLVEADPVAIRQVPMLLVLGESGKALQRAITKGDADLLFTVVQHILRSGSGSSQLHLLTANVDSRNILLLYVFACPHYRERIEEYLKSHPSVRQYLHVRDYLLQDRRLEKTIRRKTDSIATLSKTFQVEKRNILRLTPLSEAGEDSAKAPKPGPAETTGQTLSDRYLRLQAGIVEKQTRFAEEYQDKAFLTASVAEMVYLLFTHGGVEATRAAAALKEEFRLPDEMFHWSCGRAFVATEQWAALDRLGGLTDVGRSAAPPPPKPVLSGEALATLLLASHRPQQAVRHVSRIPKLEERLEFYVQCGEWGRAGADCAKSSNSDLFGQLKARTKGNAAALEQVQQGWDANISTGMTFGKFFS